MGSRGGVFVFAPDLGSLLEAGEAVTFQLRSLRGALGDPARQLCPDRWRFLEAGPAPPRSEVEAFRSRGAEDRASVGRHVQYPGAARAVGSIGQCRYAKGDPTGGFFDEGGTGLGRRFIGAVDPLEAVPATDEGGALGGGAGVE